MLGDLINVAERRSLPNLAAGSAQRVHFDTQKKYPTAEDFHPSSTTTAEDVADKAATKDQAEIFDAVRAIGVLLREKLQLSLFGFDVIIADDTGDMLVIDVNYFPSYKELEDFDHILRQHIRQTCGV